MKDALRSFSEVGLTSIAILIIMTYVYIIQSLEYRNQLYFGKTLDLKQHLKSHNSGQSRYTKKYMPWQVIWYGCFESSKKASDFERYLKTASGKAFMRKRLISV